MRFRFPVFLALSAAVSLFTGVSESAAPPRLALNGPVTPGRWLEVTPVGPGPAAKLFVLKDESRTVDLDGIAPGLYLVCVGAEARATRCERRFLEAGQVATLAGAEEGVRVTGRILLGRHPTPGVVVRVVPQPLPLRRLFTFPLFRQGQKIVGEVTTDSKGRFSIPSLAPGDYRLEIRPSGGRIEHGDLFTVPDPRRLVAQAGKPGGAAPATPPLLDLGDLILGEGLRVEVLVTDSTGQPLSGAGVGAGQPKTADGLTFTFFEAYTGAAGKAVLSGIDGSRPLGVTCKAEGFADHQQQFEGVPANVVCPLTRLSAIEGRVADIDGKALAGATISLRRTGLAVRSEPDGAFEISGLVAGTYRLDVAAPGYRGVRREVALAAEERQKLEPIRLAPAETLTGVVVDGPSGEPLPGARLTVKDPPGGGSAQTDAEGLFELKADAEDSLVLEITAADYPAAVQEVSAARRAEDEPLRIELFPGGRVRAHVWDEEEDRACFGCPLQISGGGGPGISLVTDAAGEALSDLLAPGRYQVTTVRQQSLGGVVTVSGGENVRVAEVEPGKTVEVRFGERRPVVEVVFSPAPPPGWRLWAQTGERLLWLEPEAGGTFAVRRSPGEEVLLNLGDSAGLQIRQAPIPADFAESVWALALPPTELRGVLQKAEQPAVGEAVELRSPAGGWAARARTDASGSFQVPHLAAGTYVLVVGGRPLRGVDVKSEGIVDLGVLPLK